MKFYSSDNKEPYISKNTALRISSTYAILAGLWILFSDKAANVFIKNHILNNWIHTIKGWFFVVITAYILYLMIQKGISAIEKSKFKVESSRDFYLKLLDKFPTLIWRSDVNGKCNYFNESWLKFTGKTIDEELGDGWLNGVHENDVEKCIKDYIKAFNNRQRFELEYRLKNANGEYRWIIDCGLPFNDLEENFAGYIGSCYDITERKRAEQQIKVLNTDLEKRVMERTSELENTNKLLEDKICELKIAQENSKYLNDDLKKQTSELQITLKELEAFSYSVSHDLRAPLRSIDGFSHAILEEYGSKLDPEPVDYLHRIRRASQRMAQLIDDLLDLSKLTRSEMNRTNLNISNLAETIASDISKLEPERKVEFVIQPDMSVDGDCRLLRIMMENLMDNAWKFTSERELSSIEFGKTQVNEETVYFLKDNGAGFDMNYAEKLFGAFQRLHTIDEFPGTGIGLATVQRIVNRHGGKIWAQSTIDKGTTFYFTL